MCLFHDYPDPGPTPYRHSTPHRFLCLFLFSGKSCAYLCLKYGQMQLMGSTWPWQAWLVFILVVMPPWCLVPRSGARQEALILIEAAGNRKPEAEISFSCSACQLQVAGTCQVAPMTGTHRADCGGGGVHTEPTVRHARYGSQLPAGQRRGPRHTQGWLWGMPGTGARGRLDRG